MVPLMFMGMFMHVHACSCMLNSGCPLYSATQQTQNRCGIQPDDTGGYIMVAGRRCDVNVTLSAADSMGDGRPQRQSCHSICARMDPAGGLCRAGPAD